MNIEEAKMQNYKIKVANEAESREVQQLLFELGFSWGEEGNILVCIGSNHFIANYINTNQLFYSRNVYFDAESKQEEITLPQLRDLVVLHQNDVSDATHEVIGNNDPLFITSEGELYYFHVTLNKWQKHGSTATDLILSDYARPLKEQPQMTWQDALRAVADGKEVEFYSELTLEWVDISSITIGSLKGSHSKFRISPQRKDLNGNYTKEQLLKIADEYIEAANRNKERPTILCDDWVSINDRLPMINETVLIFQSEVSIAKYIKSGFVEFYDGFDYYAEDVTHWQPLPAPPNQ